MANILVADDHVMVAEVVKKVLEPEHQVCVAKSLPETVSILHEDTWNVVLLDLDMPGMNGLESLKTLVEQFPNVKVTIFSGSIHQSTITAGLNLGCSGFISKSMSLPALKAAITVIESGVKFAPANMNMRVSDHLQFSMKEIEILNLIAAGATNKEIGDTLNEPLARIKLYVRTLCRRLNARNRAHASMLAREMGVLTDYGMTV